MPLFTKSLRLFIVVALFVTAFVGTGSIQPATAETAPTLTMSPDATSIPPGGVLGATFHVTNTGETDLAAGVITVFGASPVISSISELEEWVSAADGETEPGRVIGQVDVPAISAGGSVTVTSEFSTTPARFGYAWGPRGIAASYSLDGAVQAATRSSIVLNTGNIPAVTEFSAILPISAPPTGVGLLSEDELIALTSPAGILTKKLELAAGRPVILGVDPMIISSIEALGTQAPVSVASWLEQLISLPNPSFWLAYADADIAIQAQAGQPLLLEPVLADIEPTEVLPTPTSTPSPQEEPTLFIPTLPTAGWPLAGSVNTADVNVFTNSGLTHGIFSSGNISSASERPAQITTAGFPALVTNDSLSQALSQDRPALAAAFIAAAALDTSSTGRMYAALPRNSFDTQTLKAVQSVLDQLAGVPWASTAGLSVDSPVETGLINLGQSTERTGSAANVLSSNARIDAFSSIAENPSLLTGPSSRNALSVISAGWTEQKAWSKAYSSYLASNSKILSSVEIVTGSTVNMVGGQVNIPLSVRNTLLQPVTVNVTATSNNVRLTVLSQQTVSVPAESQKTAQIPVRANASNGQAELQVTLTSTTGVEISSPQKIVVNVRAEWETWAIGGLIVCFAGLIVVGVIRTVRKRRTQKSVE